MLLRLNFFGSDERSALFRVAPPHGFGMPVACYVHSKRMGFVPDDVKQRLQAEAKAQGVKAKGIGTDSIEYAHFVWRSGFNPKFTQLRLI